MRRLLLALLLVGLASPVQAAVTVVQTACTSGVSSPFSGSTAATVTFGGATNSANAIISTYILFSDSRTISSVSDGTSNLTLDVNVSSGTAGMRIAVASIAPGAARTAITWNISSTSGSEGAICAYEVSGLNTSDLFEASNSAFVTPANTSHSSGSVTTTVNDSFLVAVSGNGFPRAYTGDAAFTYQINATNAFASIAAGYRILSATGSYAQTLTTGGTTVSYNAIAAYNGSGGGGGGGSTTGFLTTLGVGGDD